MSCIPSPKFPFWRTPSSRPCMSYKLINTFDCWHSVKLIFVLLENGLGKILNFRVFVIKTAAESDVAVQLFVSVTVSLTWYTESLLKMFYCFPGYHSSVTKIPGIYFKGGIIRNKTVIRAGMQQFPVCFMVGTNRNDY
jgi:hypothetical protein